MQNFLSSYMAFWDSMSPWESFGFGVLLWITLCVVAGVIIKWHEIVAFFKKK